MPRRLDVRLLLAHVVLGAERERRAERLRAVAAAVRAVRAVAVRAVAVRAVAARAVARAVAVREAAARGTRRRCWRRKGRRRGRCWQGLWREELLDTLAQLDARLDAAAELDARLGPLAVVLRRPDRAEEVRAAHRAAVGAGGEREQHGGSHRSERGEVGTVTPSTARSYRASAPSL